MNRSGLSHSERSEESETYAYGINKYPSLKDQDGGSFYLNRRGFTLVELLIVMIIAGLGLMTVAPKLAESTILSDRSETFFKEIIDTHLKTASELGTQVFITGYKGSPNIQLHDGSRVQIPAGDLSDILINNERTTGSEFRIYFYPDGIFDQFEMTMTDDSIIEAVPALHQVVHR